MHRQTFLLAVLLRYICIALFSIPTHADSKPASPQILNPLKEQATPIEQSEETALPTPATTLPSDTKAETITETTPQPHTKLPPAPNKKSKITQPLKDIPANCEDPQVQNNQNCTALKSSEQSATETITENPTFKFLGNILQPGEIKRLGWSAGQSFAGGSIDSPVLVINGKRPGPKLCLTAAVHGDELNGVEIVLRVINSIKPKELKGTLIGVPIVNILGLTRGSRYLPDRRDLNRYFPGTSGGSAASRIAYLFFENVIKHCDYLVDFHTGSGKRTNLPQLRADLENPEVYQFSQHFGATAVLHHSGNQGMLRYAANNAGIPAVTFELGEPGTLQIKHVEYGIAAVETLLEKLHMLKRFRLWTEPQPQFYNSTWVRTDHGGVLISNIKLGASVSKGDKLGWVSNPISNEKTNILATIDGRILGMALNQFVLPGFAAFHIGVEAKKAPATLMLEDVISDDTEQAPPAQIILNNANPLSSIKKQTIATPDPDDIPE